MIIKKNIHIVIALQIAMMFALLLNTGCAPATKVVLLPDPDGKVGVVDVSSDKGIQTLDKPWQTTEVSSQDKAPSVPRLMNEKEVRAMFKEALTAEPIPPVFSIVFVLLPDPDGKVGVVDVSSDKGIQTLDKPWQTTEVPSQDKAAPSVPRLMDEKVVRAMFKEALAVEPIRPVFYIVYFETDSSDLTTESLKTLSRVLEEIGIRKSTNIIVSGHTDAVGSVEKNQVLSLKRAKVVADFFVIKGVHPENIDVTYHGKGNPLIPTPDGVPEPRNRRVEITVR